MLSKLWTLIRTLFRKSEMERELDEELRHHIEQQSELNIRLGMSPQEARIAARKVFGGVEQSKEWSRDARGVNGLEVLWQDLRYGARILIKNPGFTFIAVITLALGIGANTAIFSVVNGVLLNPFPYPSGNRLTTLYTNTPRDLPGMLQTDVVPSGIFTDWRAQQRSFSEMFGFTITAARFTGAKGSELLTGIPATASFFETLGVKPILGRGFLPEEEVPGHPKVVVISHTLWQNQLNADSNVIGKTLRLNGKDHTIIGVLPPDFKFFFKFELLLPWELDRDDEEGLAVIARLKDGVTFEHARAETKLITERLRQAASRPGDAPVTGANLVPLSRLTAEDSRRALWILFAATSFVLLIACANLANLLTARAAGRQREIAIRAALGAGRRRLISQLMAESLLLALLGGAVGILMAWWSIDWLVSLAPADLTVAHQIAINAWVFSFTLLSVTVTAAFFGLAPAWRASKPDLTQSLKTGTILGEVRQHSINFRSLLIVGEVALAMVLLTGAGLLINSLIRLLNVNPGFAPENILAVNVPLWLSDGYRTREQKIGFYQRTIAQLAAIPGVEAVATINILPFGEASLRTIFSIEGRPEPPGREANPARVSHNYFDVMRIPIVRGRGFSVTDTEKSPGVVVISESLVRRYFADGDPLGRRISFGKESNGKPIWLEIVGVTGDVKQMQLHDAAFPTIYTASSQRDGGFWDTFVLRSSTAPESLIASVRKEIQAIDPELPLYKPNSLTAMIAETTRAQRFNAFLLGSLAVLASALAAVGLYGVMSYLVAHRMREIGIRMALGAQSGDVLRLVMRQGMAPVLVGLIVGVAAAVALTRLMKNILFEVSATDPATFALSVSFLVCAALLAIWIPAKRALRVDPMVVLRN
jgi:putative ABC transport system permease protein